MLFEIKFSGYKKVLAGFQNPPGLLSSIDSCKGAIIPVAVVPQVKWFID